MKLLSPSTILAIALLIPVSLSQASELNLEKYRGQVVYLDFWASWCSPCRQSFPFMNELNAKFKDKGLAVVSVNVDEVTADAKQFLTEFPASFEVIYDENGKLAKAYQLKAMPTSFLFDRDGKQVGSHMGFKLKDAAELKKAISNLLAKN